MVALRKDIGEVAASSDMACGRHIGDGLNGCRRRGRELLMSPKYFEASKTPPRSHNVRLTQVRLVAASRLMCYLSRSQLGLLLPFLTSELQLTSADQGFLMSRYASGYILTQILGGMLADRFGGYIVVAMVIFFTAVCCFLAPILASFGADFFGIPFFIMGLFQGAVMPAGNVLMARWVLPNERSWASAVTGMGACMGTLLISFIAAPIASIFGWRAVFHCTVGLSICFLTVWLLRACSSPEYCTSISEEERCLLQEAGLVSSKADTPKQIKTVASKKKTAFLNPQLFLHASVWVVIFAHFVQNSQQAFADWLPLFYSTQLSVSPDAASFYMTLIASVELPARALTKSLPETMSKRGMTLLRSRKMMSLQGFLWHFLLLMAIVVLLRLGVHSPVIFTFVFALSKAVQALHAGGYFANYLDLTQNYAGMLTGVGNTLASVAGILVPKFVALNLQDGREDWLPVLIGLMTLGFAAMLFLAKFMSTDCLDEVGSAN